MVKLVVHVGLTCLICIAQFVPEGRRRKGQRIITTSDLKHKAFNVEESFLFFFLFFCLFAILEVLLISTIFLYNQVLLLNYLFFCYLDRSVL